MSPQMTGLLINATWQTLLMVGVATLFAVVFGLPLGVILFATQKNNILEGVSIHRCLALIVNGVRSIPFIILMVAITPFTQLVVGTSIGTIAAMVPLALAAIPFLARIIESALKEVPLGLIEASTAMGATPLQIVWRVLLPESQSAIIRGVTLTLVTLIGYSAMAGAVGGGGLGDVGVRYGYDRFEIGVMLVTIAILIVMVQLLQWLGDWLASRLSR
ncbi:MAG: ABC transporter permease [Gammaproteobacteria bacterium]|nr:ABC transporter permease [Gammaproteobacteria bacterium]